MFGKFWKRVGVGVAACGVLAGTYLVVIQMTGNFAEVLPDQLYRSAQPSADDIARYAERYGIKTVVNLRGASDAKWYRQEVAATQKAGIKLIDFGMSASRPLTSKQTDQLIALLKDAPKPILIHCKSGSDRTGLVSIIYLQRLAGVDEETAEGQLSIRFGHIGIPYLSPTYAMDESWEDLEKYFGLPS
ncbi:dual specificity protein phosphatase family protein [Rhizobium sp. KVB221]|uniref:Dual specificity protein phosphatase family protein n=1 Tax=Rhizobium setariae TaxID=2801340 RepID=A0A937CN89_9HYPH|nr:dual specificity protein phosphatase family protein [Rhizobium setariae]MBL0370447.1 dual specificity protein phosphatase family protein [Rhizobium setariae]